MKPNGIKNEREFHNFGASLHEPDSTNNLWSHAIIRSSDRESGSYVAFAIVQNCSTKKRKPLLNEAYEILVLAGIESTATTVSNREPSALFRTGLSRCAVTKNSREMESGGFVGRRNGQTKTE